MSTIPVDMDDLVVRYGRLITYVIRYTVPHHLSPEDLQDLQQDVLVRVLQTDYLSRCRVYAATVTDYSFSASLRELVKNAALKYLRRRHAAMRDPMLETPLDSPEAPGTRPVAVLLRVEDDVETRALHAARIERVRRHLIAGRRVIGRQPAVKVLDEALQRDGSLPKYALRRMKRYVEDLHA